MAGERIPILEGRFGCLATGFNLIRNGIIFRPTPINRDLNGGERLKRKRGAQIGNVNAMRHGRYSPRITAARIEAWKARQEEERKKSDEWGRSCPQIDYGRIVDELIRLRREKEAG